MDMKEEMMNDAIDDVIGDEEDDEERLVRRGDFSGAIFYLLYSQSCVVTHLLFFLLFLLTVNKLYNKSSMSLDLLSLMR